jgi:hypothetical protein
MLHVIPCHEQVAKISILKLLLKDNKNVQNGIANGTSTKFVKAYLIPGAKLQLIQMFGYWVNSVRVDAVDQLDFE